MMASGGSVIDKAERVSRRRAAIFYLLAGVLVLSVLTAGEVGERPLRLLPWLCMVALGATNLWTVGVVRSPRLKALLNDESTRAHRSAAMSAGFVAALASGACVTVVAALTPLSAVLAGKVVITASLAAALGCFATLELRASR
ncbi:hypothetical protein [Sphingomonas aracearum]|uniref:Uncharacterized protein n=1 Tax=Sphingomonas aracearum TaxID=2283317 RepID=A0A369VRV1_9SPHN|nr:hypothetical protein [Sphingomonas aracearum]RDE04609.1 hypothetical protein DVW87_13490 [Sphingomonas aracearum]